MNKALQLPQLRKAVARVKKLQNTIAHSWKMKRDLIKVQEFLQVDVVALPSACETRWSTLKLCSRFLDNQLPLCKMLQGYPSKKNNLMPEAHEVTSLEALVEATTVLKDVATNLAGEKYTTGSSILPLYRKAKKVLKPKEMDSQLKTWLH